MARTTTLALLSLALVLVVWPLTVFKPGLPGALKADEPAYYLMALSLARDGDVTCEPRDLRRLWEEFPSTTSNLILASDDGWHTVHFGKPYIYSLLAVPFVVPFGSNGMVALNIILLMAMVWMGTSYLRRFNPEPLAALFSVGFFFLSSAMSYAFWLQPEVFNMAAVMASLYFGFHILPAKKEVTGAVSRVIATVFNPATQPGWSGATIMFAAYNKPMVGAVALPVLFQYLHQRRKRDIVVWIASGMLAAALLSGIGYLLTGHPSAYLGYERTGFTVESPDVMPVQPRDARVVNSGEPTQSYDWLFRVPRFDYRYFMEDVGYFLWGRHVGVLLYQPLAFLALLFFLLHERRSPVRWSLVLILAAVAVYFILWIPGNWHGGGGFVGNRYFINVYPAVLFLVTRIAPCGLIPPAYALASLFVGALFFTPFGMPVPAATLQAHTRGYPFQLFPREMSLKRLIPGYEGATNGSVWMEWRRDAVREVEDDLWLLGASRTEIWVQTLQPLESAVFHVRSEAPLNHVTIELEGDREEVTFTGPETREIELNPVRPWMRRTENIWTADEVEVYLYRLLVTSSRGEPTEIPPRRGSFLLGTAIHHLGSRAELTSEPYALEWGKCDVPDHAEARRPFVVVTRVTNRSQVSWESEGGTPIQLSYHWLSETGTRITWEGRRTPFPSVVPPGGSIGVAQIIDPPDTPGRYILVLDVVRERVAWFSDRNGGNTVDVPVQVVPFSPDPVKEAP